jgi:hypothetical protein
MKLMHVLLVVAICSVVVYASNRVSFVQNLIG